MCAITLVTKYRRTLVGAILVEKSFLLPITYTNTLMQKEEII
jgi:hypothetical protein